MGAVCAMSVGRIISAMCWLMRMRERSLRAMRPLKNSMIFSLGVFSGSTMRKLEPTFLSRWPTPARRKPVQVS